MPGAAPSTQRDMTLGHPKPVGQAPLSAGARTWGCGGKLVACGVCYPSLGLDQGLEATVTGYHGQGGLQQQEFTLPQSKIGMWVGPSSFESARGGSFPPPPASATPSIPGLCPAGLVAAPLPPLSPWSRVPSSVSVCVSSSVSCKDAHHRIQTTPGNLGCPP